MCASVLTHSSAAKHARSIVFCCVHRISFVVLLCCVVLLCRAENSSLACRAEAKSDSPNHPSMHAFGHGMLFEHEHVKRDVKLRQSRLLWSVLLCCCVENSSLACPAEAKIATVRITPFPTDA